VQRHVEAAWAGPASTEPIDIQNKAPSNASMTPTWNGGESEVAVALGRAVWAIGEGIPRPSTFLLARKASQRRWRRAVLSAPTSGPLGVALA
jgi:hypothetical protein